MSEASFPITGHSCLPGMSAFFFSLPSLGRGRGLDQGCNELRLAHGLSFPCMALEQDQWHVISLNSQTWKQVTLFPADTETGLTRLRLAQEDIAVKGSKPLTAFVQQQE